MSPSTGAAPNSYKALKGTRYPVTVDTLMAGVVAAPAGTSDAGGPTELEEMPEAEEATPTDS